MTDRLKTLADAGVAIWLDDISRMRLTSGNLADLVANSHVVGVTSNPTIFGKAIADADSYKSSCERSPPRAPMSRRPFVR